MCHWSLVVANSQLQDIELLAFCLVHNTRSKPTAIVTLLCNLGKGHTERYPVSKMLGTQTCWQFSQNVCISILKYLVMGDTSVSMKLICLTHILVTS